MFSRRAKYGDQAPKSPLYGAYRVDKVSGTEHIDPIRWKILEHSNPIKWKTLMMDGLNYSAIKFIDDGLEFSDVKTDTTAKIISFVSDKNTDYPQKFNYSFVDPDHLVLKSVPGDSIIVELTKIKFLLTDRGLNWINEVPFNR